MGIAASLRHWPFGSRTSLCWSSMSMLARTCGQIANLQQELLHDRVLRVQVVGLLVNNLGLGPAPLVHEVVVLVSTRLGELLLAIEFLLPLVLDYPAGCARFWRQVQPWAVVGDESPDVGQAAIAVPQEDIAVLLPDRRPRSSSALAARGQCPRESFSIIERACDSCRSNSVTNCRANAVAWRLLAHARPTGARLDGGIGRLSNCKWSNNRCAVADRIVEISDGLAEGLIGPVAVMRSQRGFTLLEQGIARRSARRSPSRPAGRSPA